MVRFRVKVQVGVKVWVRVRVRFRIEGLHRVKLTLQKPCNGGN